MSELVVHDDPYSPREPASQSNVDLPSTLDATHAQEVSDDLRRRLDKVLFSEVCNDHFSPVK